MKDESKTRAQLIDELAELRQRVTKLETKEAEQVRAEETLHRQALVFENLYDAVIVTDLEGNIIDWNPAATRMYGYSKNEMLGQTAEILNKPEGSVSLTSKIIEGITHDGHWAGEVNFVRQDGIGGVSETVVLPLSDKRGNQIALIGINHDVTERVRSEQALRESEEKYRQLFELESDAIFLIDNETGRILEVNSAGPDLYGYSREELLQKRNIDLSAEPAETRKATLGGWTQIPVRFHRKKDGTVFPVEITGRHFTWHGRQVHIAAIRDTTERMRAEEALRESEERFRTLVEQSTLAIEIYSTDGILLQANKASEELWGVSMEPFIGKMNALDEPQATETGVRPYFEKVLAGEPQLLPEREYDPQKVGLPARARWLRTRLYPLKDQNDVVQNIVIMHEDITERMRAEQALRESEKRYHALFEEAPVMYLTVRDEGDTSIVSNCNTAFLATLGYTRDEVTEQPLASFYTPESQAALLESDGFRKALEDKMETSVERNLVARDGHVIVTLLRAVPEIDETGKVIGIRAMFTDITERKQAEEELKRYRDHLEELVTERTRELEEAQAELLRRERLSTLGQLTAAIAHEIRNPLGTVRTCVFGIEDAIARDEMGRVERALQLAERNILRCDHIISKLLDYTHDRALQLKPTPIDTWLEVVLDEQTFPKDIVCARELNSDVEVPIDSEHLRRAIVNLVDNAVDVLQEKQAVGNRLTVATRAIGDRLEIRISDTGPGIPTDVLDRIFEPLFSTKTYGIGLGLAIAKSMVEEHGGSIDVESIVGEGSTFTIKLPVMR